MNEHIAENKNEQGDTIGSHYKIPKEPGKKIAIFLTVLMHLVLILFLWIGVRWQSKEPVGVDAEIWDVQTRAAAPAPQISYVPPPRIENKMQKTQPTAEQKVLVPDSEIAIARAREEKKLQLLKKKRLEEQQKELKLEAEKEQQQRKDNLLKEQKKQAFAKLEQQKKADALIEQQRLDNLKRLTGQTPGSGDAVKSTGNNRVDPSYAGRIAAKIKSNMVYVGTDNGLGNPTVDFRIDLFPDGSLRGVPRKTKSSGVPSFDEAVERAITKSAPYPADTSGKVPSTIPLTYRLKD